MAEYPRAGWAAWKHVIYAEDEDPKDLPFYMQASIFFGDRANDGDVKGRRDLALAILRRETTGIEEGARRERARIVEMIHDRLTHEEGVESFDNSQGCSALHNLLLMVLAGVRTCRGSRAEVIPGRARRVTCVDCGGFLPVIRYLHPDDTEHWMLAEHEEAVDSDA